MEQGLSGSIKEANTQFQKDPDIHHTIHVLNGNVTRVGIQICGLLFPTPRLYPNHKILSIKTQPFLVRK